MPIVRPLYRGLKQVFETLFSKSGATFRTVGLVEFPAPGMWSLVFLSTPPGPDITARLPNADEHVSVFMPCTPNPTTGFFFYLPARRVDRARHSGGGRRQAAHDRRHDPARWRSRPAAEARGSRRNRADRQGRPRRRAGEVGRPVRARRTMAGHAMFDRGGAHLLHGAVELEPQQFQHALDAGLPKAPRPQIYGRRRRPRPPAVGPSLETADIPLAANSGLAARNCRNRGGLRHDRRA